MKTQANQLTPERIAEIAQMNHSQIALRITELLNNQTILQNTTELTELLKATNDLNLQFCKSTHKE